MQTVKLKVNITSDHRLDGIVPDDVPPGEMDGIALYQSSQSGTDDQITRIFLFPQNTKKNANTGSVD